MYKWRSPWRFFLHLQTAEATVIRLSLWFSLGTSDQIIICNISWNFRLSFAKKRNVCFIYFLIFSSLWVRLTFAGVYLSTLLKISKPATTLKHPDDFLRYFFALLLTPGLLLPSKQSTFRQQTVEKKEITVNWPQKTPFSAKFSLISFIYFFSGNLFVKIHSINHWSKW